MALAIKVKDLSKSFKGEAIFSNINLDIEVGKIYGFTGHNGCGKTVLFKILCGVIFPDSGEITIMNKTLGKDIDFPNNVGAIIETPGFLTDYSGFKNLNYLASIRQMIDDEQIKEAMKKVGLEPDSKKSVKKYSLGMKQRLGIAQAIMENPKILIMDEPMNSLDKSGVKQIRELLLSLKQQDTTILMTSHMAEDINILCDHVYEFDQQTLINVK
ncbi:ATP-binding cassette domain-containing protein [Salipaludibacillus sp. LMS25]|jgi:ABC-2 type transport system ATP-binding protein|uniref:ATP-binding cassette domain-containing protein n=1 Tax=Salipaludibacillus sp. LMS25 TaxID=2924031 RepID=UPI0020D02543|nr:ATP-binding cassette domain-containing protein [Salipaludibacillus sp. LMS25]UTR15925.1 ATP-binding cassette domain-containing protein [Salipaludibacillus sp. LMS25]